MKIGAHFKTEDWPDYVASVKKADEVGYDRAWLIDSQLLWREMYVYMTQGLAVTERIVFGSAVTNPFTRHLTVTASANATLAEVYPGRVILGLGRGDSAMRPMGLKPVSNKVLQESVPKLKPLMRGEEVELEGGPTHLRWAKQDVPIMMSATGPKSLRQAGALADIAMLYVGTHPESVEWAIGHVRAGAEQAGRDPDEVEISMLVGMWVSDDQEEAWAECRWSPAACANHISYGMKWNPDEKMPAPMTRLVQTRDKYDYYEGHLDSKAGHTGYLTGELVDDFAIAGPADKCLQRIRELEALGVGEISSAYLNERYDQMERVGGEVIGALTADVAR